MAGMLELIKIPDAAWKPSAFKCYVSGFGTTIGVPEG